MEQRQQPTKGNKYSCSSRENKNKGSAVEHTQHNRASNMGILVQKNLHNFLSHFLPNLGD